MVGNIRPYASAYKPFATKCKVFVHNTVYGYVVSNVVCYLYKVSYGSSDDLNGRASTSALTQHQKFQKAKTVTDKLPSLASEVGMRQYMKRIYTLQKVYDAWARGGNVIVLDEENDEQFSKDDLCK